MNLLFASDNLLPVERRSARIQYLNYLNPVQVAPRERERVGGCRVEAIQKGRERG